MVTQLSKEWYLEEILEENSIYFFLVQENMNFLQEKNYEAVVSRGCCQGGPLLCAQNLALPTQISTKDNLCLK